MYTYCSAACADGAPAACADGDAAADADRAPPIEVRAENAPARAEETAMSVAWYERADEAVARVADSPRDVDDLWDDEPASPVSAPVVGRGHTWDERAQARIDAEERGAASPAAGRRGNKRRALAIAGAVCVGGMAIAIVDAVSPSSPTDATAATDAPVAPAPAPEPAPPPAADARVDPAVLRDAAVGALRELMRSPSPRLARDAALALARVRDPDALAALGRRLDEEPSPAARLRVAYVLARSGDARGVAALEAALRDPSRDVRLDAARSLARLGNDAGRTALRAMLRVRTHRLGAAAALALLGDDAGLAVLREALAGSARVARTRAAVALGAAGYDEARDALADILTAGDRVGAAHALAALGDTRAVDALVEQLGASALRVDAAIALRRLDAQVDLAPLARALVDGDDVGRITAAEAILILTADERPAELR